jgi:competence protein ComEC
LIGFYVLLFLVVCRRRIWLSRDWAWRGIWGWIVTGLFVALLPIGRPGLRVTFLSVGHGCSILVETPNGRTLLYDVGMINDGRRAAQVAKTALWHRNHTRIDVLTISHADVDHFNGVPHLLKSVAIGRLLVPRQFLDFEQPPVLTTCEHAYQQGVPIQLLWTDDRIELDEDVSIRVLHPNIDFKSSRDNAGSLVLLIEYHGCRLLLTGDLEDEGLQRLLSQPSIDVDVLLAPHHGSLAANPVALANWAKPEWVIVSGGRAELLPELRQRYGNQCQVISTMSQGAVEFEITDSGQIQCTPFLGWQK